MSAVWCTLEPRNGARFGTLNVITRLFSFYFQITKFRYRFVTYYFIVIYYFIVTYYRHVLFYRHILFYAEMLSSYVKNIVFDVAFRNVCPCEKWIYKHINFAQNLHEHVSCRQGKTYDIINNTIDIRVATASSIHTRVTRMEGILYEVPSLYLL